MGVNNSQDIAAWVDEQARTATAEELREDGRDESRNERTSGRPLRALSMDAGAKPDVTYRMCISTSSDHCARSDPCLLNDEITVLMLCSNFQATLRLAEI